MCTCTSQTNRAEVDGTSFPSLLARAILYKMLNSYNDSDSDKKLTVHLDHGVGRITEKEGPIFFRRNGHPYEAVSHQTYLFGDAERQRVPCVRSETAAGIDLSRYHTTYPDACRRKSTYRRKLLGRDLVKTQGRTISPSWFPDKTIQQSRHVSDDIQ